MEMKLKKTGKIIEIEESASGSPITYLSNPPKYKIVGKEEYVLCSDVTASSYEYIGEGFPYAIKNPESPLQTPEETKEINGAVSNTLSAATAPKPAKHYYIIYKLRESEQVSDTGICQFVCAVEHEWIAKDICKKYKSGYTYEKCIYRKVDVED